ACCARVPTEAAILFWQQSRALRAVHAPPPTCGPDCSSAPSRPQYSSALTRFALSSCFFPLRIVDAPRPDPVRIVPSHEGAPLFENASRPGDHQKVADVLFRVHVRKLLPIPRAPRSEHGARSTTGREQPQILPRVPPAVSSVHCDCSRLEPESLRLTVVSRTPTRPRHKDQSARPCLSILRVPFSQTANEQPARHRAKHP